MWVHIYVAEKLRELDDERLSRLERLAQDRPRSRPMLAPVILRAGRALQSAGAGLESWGSPQNEREGAIGYQR